MRLEQEIEGWTIEMSTIKNHLARYIGTTQEGFYRKLYREKLEEGAKYPSHIWKGFSEYLQRKP